MKITEKHKIAANLLWQGNLTGEQIAQEVKISRRQLINWQSEPEFQSLLNEIDSERRTLLKRLFLKYSDRAIKVLVKLTEQKEEKFIYPEETVRKACVDILKGAEMITDKKDGTEGKGMSPTIHIYNNIPGILAEQNKEDESKDRF